MSNTPETDAAWEKLCCSGDSWYSIAEKVKILSQRLERERDEARDMVENLTDHGLNLMDSNRMLKRERDEAREALREIQAADWKTAGELRGMARKVLEAAK